MWAACFRLRRCGAIPRRRGASIRIASGCLLLEVVGELDEGIEADDIDGVGDEVGEGVDVVVEKRAVAVVDDVLDAADVNAGLLHDAFGGGDDFGGRRVGFDAKSALGGVERTGVADVAELFTVGGLADVAGAEVEGVSSDVHADGVKELAAEEFDTGDKAAARGDEFLHERGVVDPELDGVGGGGCGEFVGRIVFVDAGAAASDIRFYHDGEAEAFGCGGRFAGVVDHAGLGIREPEALEKRELQGFGDLEALGSGAVDDTLALGLEMGEVILGVEDGLLFAAVVGGGAGAVEDEAVLGFSVEVAGIEAVLRGVDVNGGRAAAFEFGEERLEPVLVFVVDRDGLFRHDAPWSPLVPGAIRNSEGRPVRAALVRMRTFSGSSAGPHARTYTYT